MNWRERYRSFYYDQLPPLPDIEFPVRETGLLVIDIQNVYFPAIPAADSSEIGEWERWAPFRKRMNTVVIPNTARLVRARRPAVASE